MNVQSTIDKLRELRLSAMAGAFEDQCRTGGLQGLSFEDRFGILVDREWESRRNNRLARLIRSAGFRYPGACMEDIEYHADRKLDRGKPVSYTHLILLCLVEDTDTHAICLNLMLTASQYVFYDFDRIRAYCHGFPGKVCGIPF